MKTLIVEDDFTNRLMLQKILSRYGECHVATNGKEAVEAFGISLDDGFVYDLICMDIMLPELDGVGAVRQIREMEEQRGILSTTGVKIIMTTALAEVKEVARSFHELCDFYLIKPIDAGQLLAHLKSMRLISA